MALLVGLLLLLGLIFLLVNAVDDDGRTGPADDRLGQVSSSADGQPDADAQPSADASAAVSGPVASAAAPAGGSGGGQLTADGTDLLAQPGGGIKALVGSSATGEATVQAVVADEGFWVGPSEQNRVFVVLTPEARGADGESPFQVEAGQTVQLAGSVKASSGALADKVGVDAAEGRKQLIDAGGYVEATRVSLKS